MNARDRFEAVMKFRRGIPTLKAEYGYWTTTIKRFIQEGMPLVENLPANLPDNGTISGADAVDPLGKVVVDRNVRASCGLDSYIAKFPLNFSPLFESKVLEEDNEYKTYIDEYGITMRVRKAGASTPLDLNFPIKDRRDFEAYKEHYSNDHLQRLPGNWKEISRELEGRDFPIRLGGHPYGFLGFPRHLIGTTQLFLMMYDDPALINDINEFFLGFVMDYWAHIIGELKPDCVLIWEDMASKTGSMISEQMFHRFMTPYYVRIIDFCKQYGIENILVDSDGYIEDLLPIWYKLGITGIFPIERQAGNDILRIRKQYPRMQLLGGVDKRVFTQNRGRSEIDDELEIIRSVLVYGGFIPHADHHVPDDACWENFRYYRQKLNELIDVRS
jgi:uroporphyrinogen decarboxylase